MKTVRYIIVTFLVAAGAYATFSVYQQSSLAGLIVGVLAVSIIFPVLLSGKPKAKSRARIGEKPSDKLNAGLRQARAVAMREDGGIVGAPPPKR